MAEISKQLKLFYAAALADAAYHYQNNGILDKVTVEKKRIQEFTASSQLQQLKINTIPQLYDLFTELFGCADWIINRKKESIVAKTNRCLLCAISKKQGGPKPCDLFCINPFIAFAKELGYKIDIESTLWEEEYCSFVHNKV